MSHFLSPACYHLHHDYCKNERGVSGYKKPGVCPFCDAKCICHCHTTKVKSAALRSDTTAESAAKETT